MAAGRIAAPFLGEQKSVVKGSAQLEEDITAQQQKEAQMEQMQQVGATAEAAGKAAPAMKVLQDGVGNLSEEDKAALAQQLGGVV